MASSNLDFISRLPNEIRSNIVCSIAGKDAAALRLTARVWRDTAGEGLFNICSEDGPYVGQDAIYRGIFVIRPYTNLRVVADKLREWPWMGQWIKELQIHVPDKNVETITACARAWVRLGHPLASINHISQLRPEGPHSGSDVTSLAKIFSRLPSIDSLYVFTKRCPWPENEIELHKFWEAFVCSDESDHEEFAYRFQDHNAAHAQYLGIIDALKSAKSPIHRLHLEMVPLSVFGALADRIRGGLPYEVDEILDFPGYFRGFLGKIRRVHVGIVRICS
jgi:hypothetical protein